MSLVAFFTKVTPKVGIKQGLGRQFSAVSLSFRHGSTNAFQIALFCGNTCLKPPFFQLLAFAIVRHYPLIIGTQKSLKPERFSAHFWDSISALGSISKCPLERKVLNLVYTFSLHPMCRLKNEKIQGTEKSLSIKYLCETRKGNTRCSIRITRVPTGSQR